MKPVSAFDVHTCPLAGTSLIEASAGTGKTWALCGLVLRLLLERGLTVQQILVVTFTNAATAELRERIRSRIAETLAFVRDGAAAGADPFVPDLVAALRGVHGIADADTIARLELALQTFDEAAIFTIHGFCQRALADAPFASGMPLALEPLQDDSDFIAAAANDFWRRRIAGDTLDPALAAVLVQRKDTPEKFAALLRRHLAKPLARVLWPAAPEGADAGEGVAAFGAAHHAARSIWLAGREAIAQCMQDGAEQLRQNVYKPQSIEAAMQAWDRLLCGDDALATLADRAEKADLLGEAKLKASTKKGCVTPAHPFFAAARRWLDRRDALDAALRQARIALLRELVEGGAAAVREVKRRSRVIAFDDMLASLHERLTSGAAPALAGLLRERFPAALIDEFQDTDPLQFAIFHTIYGGTPQHLALFLIGDPKQAIYSFRGADLHTYLAARGTASVAYTLADNQRASQPLIDALNAVFGANDRAFMLDGLDYPPAGFGARKREAFVDATASGGAAPLQAWLLPVDDGGSAGEPRLDKKAALAAAAQATAAEIARLIGAGHRGEITLGDRPLAAGDIAVLVRSHAQADRMREALARLGVDSVMLSQASVFRSTDAEELERVLAAILEPTRERLVRAALATVWLGHDAVAIDALARDEAQLIGWAQRLADARDAWIAHGVGVMLRGLLRSAGIGARLLARPDGERRMTNTLHLIEFLQQASRAHPAPQALLRWLQARRSEPRSADDATQLRLESDRNLVQIVTIHRSKGLQYGVVFCPFVWDGHRRPPTGLPDGVEYHDDDDRAVIDYREGFADAPDDKVVAPQRRLDAAAEDLRLIYVALTRAMHRCVIVAGGYRSGRYATTTEGHRSLLNWLVAGQGSTPQAWFDHKLDGAAIDAAWRALAARCAPAFALVPLPSAPGVPVQQQRAPAESLAALEAPARLPAGWSIGSFSALAQGATHERSAIDHDVLAGQASFDSALPPAPDALSTAAAAPGSGAPATAAAVASAAASSIVPQPVPPLADDDVLRFPRGAAAGDCVHALFERIDFTAPAGWPQAVADTLRSHAAALPPLVGVPAALRERMLLRMLDDVLRTPLAVGTGQPLRLADVTLARRLTELEFHLPSHALDAARLNALLAALGHPLPGLAFRTLRGYLKGFIDLVFEHDGRYFVLDWKSNHLGDTTADYGRPAIDAAMTTHGYHLQALLYCLALDRMLRARLPGYDPARHFGGAIYLFVRGVRPGWVDARGAPTGVHVERPAPQSIARASALFDGVETA